ncbi:hypothetical protein NQZ68_008010 [Dissostichus eleginoides]|nr:hypothetical protein NQZ68_008010 [Dissostichus eleginoides]
MDGDFLHDLLATSLEVMWTWRVQDLKDGSHSQIKQHSLSVKRLAPKTAKPEENEPPHDPRCG